MRWTGGAIRVVPDPFLEGLLHTLQRCKGCVRIVRDKGPRASVPLSHYTVIL